MASSELSAIGVFGMAVMGQVRVQLLPLQLTLQKQPSPRSSSSPFCSQTSLCCFRCSSLPLLPLQNLALNIASKGIRCSVCNRSPEKVRQWALLLPRPAVRAALHVRGRQRRDSAGI